MIVKNAMLVNYVIKFIVNLITYVTLLFLLSFVFLWNAKDLQTFVPKLMLRGFSLVLILSIVCNRHDILHLLGIV